MGFDGKVGVTSGFLGLVTEKTLHTHTYKQNIFRWFCAFVDFEKLAVVYLNPTQLRWPSLSSVISSHCPLCVCWGGPLGQMQEGPMQTSLAPC